MIKILIFSLFLAFITVQSVSACSIDSYPNIIKLNKILDDSIIKKSDCDSKTQRTFIDLISGGSGELKSLHLTQILRSEFNKVVEISPKSIKVEAVRETLTRLIEMPSNLALNKTTSLFDKASLNLQTDSRIKASCNTCQSAGSKNIKLRVDGKTIWFSAEILIKRVGFVINEAISPYTKKLSKNLFRQTLIFDKGRDHLFQDIKNIRFYKPTRQLEAGKVLKISDLIPMTVISPGQRIKVILKGKNISLNSSALSRQSGKIGQFIEVYNQKTDSSQLRWINDCEVIFKTINPKNRAEKKDVHLKILTTTDSSYTYEYSYVGEIIKQKGIAYKVK